MAGQEAAEVAAVVARPWTRTVAVEATNRMFGSYH